LRLLFCVKDRVYETGRLGSLDAEQRHFRESTVAAKEQQDDGDGLRQISVLRGLRRVDVRTRNEAY